MVRLVIASLLVSASAVCPAPSKTTFSAEGHASHLDAESACDDLVNSVRDHLGTVAYPANLKDQCLAAAEGLQGTEVAGKWYDPNWNLAADCSSATASLETSWLTCSGSGLEEVCFLGNPDKPDIQIQRRFYVSGDKGAGMCNELGAALSPRNGPLETALNYGSAAVAEECKKALGGLAGDGKAGICDRSAITTSIGKEYCFIDTLDQMCATALMDNDASLQKERHGCRCIDRPSSFAGRTEKDALTSLMSNQEGKQYQRIELAVFDANDAAGSTNQQVASVDELLACLKCRDCDGECGNACKLKFPDTQPYWETTNARTKGCKSAVHPDFL